MQLLRILLFLLLVWLFRSEYLPRPVGGQISHIPLQVIIENLRCWGNRRTNPVSVSISVRIVRPGSLAVVGWLPTSPGSRISPISIALMANREGVWLSHANSIFIILVARHNFPTAISSPIIVQFHVYATDQSMKVFHVWNHLFFMKIKLCHLYFPSMIKKSDYLYPAKS